MNKRDILIAILIFIVVFSIVSFILLIEKGKTKELNIIFYPNPYNYTVNISNNTIYINLNDIQLPYINTSELILNISNNIYSLTCSNEIVYQNQSTLCKVENISVENVTYIQLLYPYNNVLYNIVYKV